MIRIIISIILLCLSLMSSSSFSTPTDGWPRTFHNADGSSTQIETKPQRILSTSVTATGTLLAIDAPIVASATAGDGQFFAQWREIAHERNVQKLWQAGAIDLEMAYSVMPDLIVVSIGGADSVMEQVAELQLLAPVIIVDYGGQTWQSLAKELGYAVGHENSVQEKIEEFNQYVNTLDLDLPALEANIIAYNGPGITNSIAKEAAPHSELVHALGFDIEGAKDEWEILGIQRSDFARVHYETLIRLKAPVTFIISANDTLAKTVMSDPVLANLPSVINKQVYPLGPNSFRIDYYSSLEVISQMQDLFGRVK